MNRCSNGFHVKSECRLDFNRVKYRVYRNNAFGSLIEDDSWDSGELYSSAPFREHKQLVIQERQEDLESAIEPMRQQGLDVRAKLLHGKPFLEIIREVLRKDHDLVIRTAQGEGGLKGMLFGSTATHLMRKCPCPVWVVKEEENERYDRIIASVDPDPSTEQRNKLNVKITDVAISLAKVLRDITLPSSSPFCNEQNDRPCQRKFSTERFRQPFRPNSQ